MEITLRVGQADRELVKVLLKGRYSGWDEYELLRTLGGVALHQSLVDHVEWEKDDELRDRGEAMRG